MAANGLTMDNSDIIGFVVACAFSSAINLDELRKWCSDVVIKNNRVEEIPEYIFELMDFNMALMHIFKIIGFIPSWKRTDAEDDALMGIAAYRGQLASDATMNEEQAKQLLADHPKILEKFKATFPFIDLPI